MYDLAVVVAVDRRHRQHVAAVGVHDDDRARLGAELADAAEQRLLDGELDRAVEGEDDVAPGHRLLR